MKLTKILSVILALSCVLALVACGNQSKTQTTTSTVADTTTTTASSTTTTTTVAPPTSNLKGKTIEGKSVFSKIDYTAYIPSTYNPDEAMPMVMALHGGYQGTLIADKSNRTLFADFTGLNNYAEQYGFIVVYPRQEASNHFYGIDYWNWYSQQDRDDIEPKALYDIVCEVKGEYNIDESNVFICGFSAGAVMAEIVAVTYPEVFTGCCILAGVSYKANEASNAVVVQTSGPNKTNEQLAQEIITGMGSNKQIKKLLVVTGTEDIMVNPKNATAAASAWAIAMKSVKSSLNTNIKTETAIGENNVGYTKSVYASLNGEEICTLYEIDGMNHFWPGAVPGISIDPAFNTDFAFDGGINLNEVMCEFFGLDK